MTTGSAEAVAKPGYLAVLSNPRMAAALLLGFASGLPLALSSGTLQAWVTVEGIDIKTIGWLTLAGIPYTYKFLWAPLFDRYAPPFLDRRRGWLVLMQVALAAILFGMSAHSPRESMATLAVLAIALAVFSASQDIVFDAYRTELLHGAERDAGSAASQLGYRLAMIASGGVALILADRYGGFPGVYRMMAGLMLLAALATVLSPRPPGAAHTPASLGEALVEPFREFFSREGALWLLALTILYKVGDAFAVSLSTTFLLRGVGFTLTEVGTVNKVFGLIATIAGLLAGGLLLVRLRLWRALLLFGLLQAATNLLYLGLAVAGKSYPLLVFAVGLDNLCGGMGSVAFVSLLMALCDQRFTATQYALLSALAAFGRVYVGPASGYLVEALGWPPFFALTFLFALPGVALLWPLRGVIRRYEDDGAAT